MSEHTALLILAKTESQLDDWQTLLMGLCNGELGAYFEERIEPFGEEAESVVEDLLDEWDERHSPPVFSDYNCAEGIITFTLTSGGSIVSDVAALTHLFRVCGAEVTVKESYLVDED